MRDLTCCFVARLLLNIPYLGILFGVAYTVPALFMYWFAGRLWPLYVLRNAYIVAGWDPVVHRTTRSLPGLLSRACALLRLLLMFVCFLLTINSVAGLVSGNVVGYFDTLIVLQVPNELYWVRYLVWIGMYSPEVFLMLWRLLPLLPSLLLLCSVGHTHS